MKAEAGSPGKLCVQRHRGSSGSTGVRMRDGSELSSASGTSPTPAPLGSEAFLCQAERPRMALLSLLSLHRAGPGPPFVGMISRIS